MCSLCCAAWKFYRSVLETESCFLISGVQVHKMNHETLYDAFYQLLSNTHRYFNQQTTKQNLRIPKLVSKMVQEYGARAIVARLSTLCLGPLLATGLLQRINPNPDPDPDSNVDNTLKGLLGCQYHFMKKIILFYRIDLLALLITFILNLLKTMRNSEIKSLKARVNSGSILRSRPMILKPIN